MIKKPNATRMLFRWCWYILAIALIVALFPDVTLEGDLERPVPLWLLCIMPLEFLLLAMIFDVFTSRTKGLKALFEIERFVMAVGVGLSLRLLLPVSGAEFGNYLGSAMLVVLAILVILLWRMPQSSYTYIQMNKHKSGILFGTTLFILALLGSTFWVDGMWGIFWPEIHLEGDLLGYFSGQLSLTFITISVMGVLSDKSVVVYWENIAEAKLIRPLFGSFASYTAYSIAVTVGAGISAFMDNHLAFAVFFVVNIPILILLTLTMVDVYFGREEKKRTREIILRRMTEYRLKQDLLKGKLIRQEEADKILAGAAEYKDIMLNLEYQLHQNIEGHNVPYLREVAELYGRNMHCFPFPEGQSVVTLLFTAPVELWPMILDGVASRTAELEEFNATHKAFKAGSWNGDAHMWRHLSLNSHLQDGLKDKEVAKQLTDIVLRRLSLLQKDMLKAASIKARLVPNSVRVCFGENNDLYIFRRIPQQNMWAALQANSEQVLKKDGLLSSLVKLLLLLLETKDAELCLTIAEHPTVQQMQDEQLQKLGFDEQQIGNWNKLLKR